jgi:hypothetical protein
MQLNKTLIRPFTFSLNMNLPYTIDEVNNEIKAYDFTPLGKGRHISGFRSKILDEIQQAIIDHSFLDEFYKFDEFRQMWPTLTLEELKNKTSFNCALYKDSPGFSMGSHLDSRQLVVVGMIFLNPTNIPEQNTILYSNKLKDDPRNLPSGLGDGWVMANAHNTWHSGGNKSNQDRYSILFNYAL